MANFQSLDMMTVDDLFIKDGNVLKYSDATFARFFAEELNIGINTEKYYAEGNSKGTGGEGRLYRVLRGEEQLA
jgi:hypothetical protein